MDKMLSLFKALSDRNRLRILAALMFHPELCACQITALLQVTGATVSRHLGILVSSGLLKSRKDGRWVYFKIRKNQAFKPMMAWIRTEMTGSEWVENDRAALKDIVAMDTEALCRRQRGEACCPKQL